MKVHIRGSNARVRCMAKHLVEEEKIVLDTILGTNNKDRTRAFLLVKKRGGKYRMDLSVITYISGKPVYAERSLKKYLCEDFNSEDEDNKSMGFLSMYHKNIFYNKLDDLVMKEAQKRIKSARV